MRYLLILLLGTSVVAQTLLMPPMPPSVDRKWVRPPRFRATCPTCSYACSNLVANTIVTNGGRAVAGGNMVERTISLTCAKCQATFNAKNEKFVPVAVAYEEVDTELRVSIKLTNCVPPGALEGPAVEIRIPTIVGRLYECQASDDDFKSWLGSTPRAGTGGVISQFESPSHPRRMYRVRETPL